MPTGVVTHDYGRPLRSLPAIAPLTKGCENNSEIPPLFCQVVVESRRVTLVLTAFHHARGHEAIQTGGVVMLAASLAALVFIKVRSAETHTSKEASLGDRVPSMVEPPRVEAGPELCPVEVLA